jgi:hypothetical protein
MVERVLNLVAATAGDVDLGVVRVDVGLHGGSRSDVLGTARLCGCSPGIATIIARVAGCGLMPGRPLASGHLHRLTRRPLPALSLPTPCRPQPLTRMVSPTAPSCSAVPELVTVTWPTVATTSTVAPRRTTTGGAQVSRDHRLVRRRGRPARYGPGPGRHRAVVPVRSP